MCWLCKVANALTGASALPYRHCDGSKYPPSLALFRAWWCRVLPTMCLILSTAALLIWLNQHALFRYWQQRYHTDPPWASWQGIPMWDFGARLYQAVETAGQVFVAQLSPNENLDLVIAKPPTPKVVFPKGFLRGSVALNSLSTQPTSESPIVHPESAPDEAILLTVNDRVLFIGDSLMQGVAPRVKRTLLAEAQIQSLDLSRQSTGLRYPAFFNWPQTLMNALTSHPDIAVVIVFLGPNDPWGLPADDTYPASPFKSPLWETRYRSRIAQILEISQQHHARVIWVGPPNMRDMALSQGMQYLRPLYQSEVKKAGEIYLDANAILNYKETSYTETHTDIKGTRKVRTGDGIHFTPKGQETLAKAIMTKLRISSVMPEGMEDNLITPQLSSESSSNQQGIP